MDHDDFRLEAVAPHRSGGPLDGGLELQRGAQSRARRGGVTTLSVSCHTPTHRMTKYTARLSALVIAAALLAACGRAHVPIILATTSSVANSGLLDRLLPAYEGSAVHVLPVGSGLALNMLATHQADVVISHAPAREAAALRTHPTWWYRKVFYNDFLIVGPAHDPADIAGSSDAVEAMARIADARVRFISRGDESGTHERERELWQLAGGAPPDGRLVAAGASMGMTLRIASEMGSYTLTDRGTFEALSESVKLAALVAGDPRLLNTYAVLADPAHERGLRFARWLVHGAGRDVLADLLVTEQVRGFSLWPAGAPAEDPTARPDASCTPSVK